MTTTSPPQHQPVRRSSSPQVLPVFFRLRAAAPALQQLLSDTPPPPLTEAFLLDLFARQMGVLGVQVDVVQQRCAHGGAGRSVHRQLPDTALHSRRELILTLHCGSDDDPYRAHELGVSAVSACGVGGAVGRRVQLIAAHHGLAVEQVPDVEAWVLDLLPPLSARRAAPLWDPIAGADAVTADYQVRTRLMLRACRDGLRTAHFGTTSQTVTRWGRRLLRGVGRLLPEGHFRQYSQLGVPPLAIPTTAPTGLVLGTTSTGEVLSVDPWRTTLGLSGAREHVAAAILAAAASGDTVTAPAHIVRRWDGPLRMLPKPAGLLPAPVSGSLSLVEGPHPGAPGVVAWTPRGLAPSGCEVAVEALSATRWLVAHGRLRIAVRPLSV